jgi:hypothetical protein
MMKRQIQNEHSKNYIAVYIQPTNKRLLASTLGRIISFNLLHYCRSLLAIVQPLLDFSCVLDTLALILKEFSRRNAVEEKLVKTVIRSCN